jgi:hypothetical protein
VVEPAEVLHDRELELRARAPDAVGDQLGLEAVNEALGQRVVLGVADRADRGQHAVIRDGDSRRALGTTRELVVRPGAVDGNHWTKRARVPRRLGLLLVVPSRREPDAGAGAHLSEAMRESEAPRTDGSARVWPWRGTGP